VRLNLGCGKDQLPGWVNVDACPILPGTYEVWDLDEHPWPFEDNSASEIRGIDIYEHVHDPVGFMAECHRILEPGGLLRLQTAYWTLRDGYTDPTHKRVSTEDSFDFWIEGTIYYDAQNLQMGGFRFEPGAEGKHHARLNMDTGQLDVLLRKPADG